MKSWWKSIKNQPIIIVLILALIIYLPSGLASQSESNKKAIATAMAIDTAGPQVELSISALMPIENLTFTERNQVISARGDTVTEALLNISLHVGKAVALAHVNIVIISDSFADSNIGSIIDHVSRSYDISNNAFVIISEGSAKEVLKTGQKLRESLGVDIADIVRLNGETTQGVEATLESFFNGFFSLSKVSIVPVVKMTQNDYEGIEVGVANASTGGNVSQPSSGGGQSSQQQKKIISNDGEAIILKNGKFVTKLSKDIVRGYNWVNPIINSGTFSVKNVNNDFLKNATLEFDIKYKDVVPSVKFENGIPVFNAEIEMVVVATEIRQNEVSKKALNSQQTFVDDIVKSKIEQIIKKEIAEVFKITKQQKLDVFNIYEKFDASSQSKKFKQLIKSKYGENYLDYISFRVSVQIKEKS